MKIKLTKRQLDTLVTASIQEQMYSVETYPPTRRLAALGFIRQEDRSWWSITKAGREHLASIRA